MLHGEIKVNDQKIVEYEIINLLRGTDVPWYGCTVTGRDKAGYPYGFNFEIEFKGTAPALIAAVMTEVDERLRA